MSAPTAAAPREAGSQPSPESGRAPNPDTVTPPRPMAGVPDEEPKSRKLVSPRPLGRLIPRLRPYAGRLAIAAVGLVLAACAGLAFPQVVRFLLDAAFESGDRSQLDRIAIGLVGLFAVQGALNFMQVYLLTSTTERVIAKLREDLFAHLVHLSPSSEERRV